MSESFDVEAIDKVKESKQKETQIKSQKVTKAQIDWLKPQEIRE